MEEKFYSRDTVDAKFQGVHDRFDNQDKRFDSQDQALEKILIQTTRHNGRMTKIEKILLVVGCVSATLLLVNGSELVKFVMSII